VHGWKKHRDLPQRVEYALRQGQYHGYDLSELGKSYVLRERLSDSARSLLSSDTDKPTEDDLYLIFLCILEYLQELFYQDEDSQGSNNTDNSNITGDKIVGQTQVNEWYARWKEWKEREFAFKDHDEMVVEIQKCLPNLKSVGLQYFCGMWMLLRDYFKHVPSATTVSGKIALMKKVCNHSEKLLTS
jgi:hypothetical protein